MASAISPPNSQISRVASARSEPRPGMRWSAILLGLVCLACNSLALTAEAPESAEVLLLDPRVPFLEDGKWVMLAQEEIDLRIKKRAEVAPTMTTTFEIALQTVTQQSSS